MLLRKQDLDHGQEHLRFPVRVVMAPGAERDAIVQVMTQDLVVPSVNVVRHRTPFPAVRHLAPALGHQLHLVLPERISLLFQCPDWIVRDRS